MSAPLLFIAADPREFSGLLAHWEGVRSLPLSVNWARRGRWKGRSVVAIANGAGVDRAYAGVLLAKPVAAVCNIGFCGALDPSLAIGDVVVASEVRNQAARWHPAAPQCSAPHSGVVASIDRVAATAREKAELRATGASVVEMEAAGAARASNGLNVPFYCIRVVSDLAGEDFANDFNAALDSFGRFSPARLVRGALADPVRRFRELLVLKRRTEAASKSLGDFLASCSF